MSTITTKTSTPVPGNNMLERDREQAHLLHEPNHIYTSIDPITGRDIIVDREKHPHLDDGNVTFYFENEQTRKEYLDMPLVEPYPKLPFPPSPQAFPPSPQDDRGG